MLKTCIWETFCDNEMPNINYNVFFCLEVIIINNKYIIYSLFVSFFSKDAMMNVMAMSTGVWDICHLLQHCLCLDNVGFLSVQD